MQETNIQVTDQTSSQISPIVQALMNGKFEVAQLSAMLDAQEKFEAMLAKKAFQAAFARFKSIPISILKTKPVNHGQGKTSFKHAELPGVLEVVTPVLLECGLALNWTSEQGDFGVRVTAVLSHSLGHSISTSLSAPPDTSGAKNSVQAVGSTMTYLQRYTAKLLLGLAEEDDDGQGASAPAYISADQVENLQFLISQVKTREPAELTASMLARLKVSTLGQIPLAQYDKVCETLKKQAAQ